MRELRFVAGAEELGSYALKANYRALGPRFGKQMPQAAAAIEALDAQTVAVVLREGGTVGLHVDGHEHELTAEDITLQMEPLDGYQVEREGAHAVALDLAIDAELRAEMLAREVVRAVQGARKDAGFAVSDRIALTLDGDAELVAAARAHEAFIAGRGPRDLRGLGARRRQRHDGDHRGRRAAPGRHEGVTHAHVAVVAV